MYNEYMTYKLIIIDDEQLVRDGLKTTIDWSALNIEIVAECSNGLLGLKAIHKYCPDLVICDIRMPVLDGLQLAEKLAAEKFDCAFIFYSGHSDFEYVSKALEYGVMRYLLKPIDNESLIEKIQEVIREIEARREKTRVIEQYQLGLPMFKSNLIEQLMTGENTQEILEKLKLIDVEVPLSGVVINCVVTQNLDREFKKFYSELSEALGAFGAVGNLGDDNFTIITKLKDTSVIYQRIKSLLDFEQTISECRMSVCISEAFNGRQNLVKALKSVKNLCKNILLILPSSNRVWRLEENEKNGQNKPTIAEALNIIVSDYGKKLSIKSVAERLFLSESHLMHEFKEILGKTFNECLTQYRMLKAKEMLDEGKLRTKEIAGKVGYNDVRYFAEVFKDYTGFTPSDYAQKNTKK